MKTGIFGKEYSKILTEAFEIRSESDYDDYYVPSKEEVREQIENAEKFLHVIERQAEQHAQICNRIPDRCLSRKE